MKIGVQYGCLTVLDSGEEYTESEQYSELKKEYASLQNELKKYDGVNDEDEKLRALNEYPSSSFMYDLKRNPSDLDNIFKRFAEYENHWTMQHISNLKPKLDTHYKCKCKCGKIHYYDAETIEAEPKYCYYPMFISQRMTYSVKAQNGTYNKRQKYGNLMNVIFVDNRSDCVPSDKYCSLWNKYKQQQMNKKAASTDEKEYTVIEYDRNYKKCNSHEIKAISHIEALKKLYPDDNFELVPQSDIRNRLGLCGLDYDFQVSNHYGNSVQSKTRLYKRIKK